MKKKLIIGILSTALLAGGATAALGATDTGALSEIKGLYTEMFSVQKEIVDEQVKAGAITQEQAETMKDAIDQKAEYRNQAIDKGQVFGPGYGARMGGGFCGGSGCGFNNGLGGNGVSPSTTSLN